MNLLRSLATEIIGLFVDDGALALFCVLLVAILAIAVLWLSLPAMIAAVVLLFGCVAILAWSVVAAARPK